MKNFKHYLLLAVLGLSFASCNKLVEGNDINPNVPLDAPADQQLTAAEISEGFFMSGEIPRLVGIWSGTFTGADRQYLALERYVSSAGDYDNAWATAYATTLAQARVVEDKANAVNNKALLGIAQVLEAQIIGSITALWGNVPYSEALRDTPGKFDEQASIYEATQTLLDQAITNIPQNGVYDASHDIFYGGSKTKWVAAAHSIKARHYLHVKNYARAAEEAALGIASSDGDMNMPYNGNAVSGDINPYYDFMEINRSYYISAEAAYADTLFGSRLNTKTDESARRAYFYSSDIGYYSRDLNDGDGAFAADADAPMITYVETQAILAESLARTGDATGALAALNNIRSYNATTYAGGTYSAYTTADFTTGGLLNTVAGQSSDQALLVEILTEKYLSLIGQLEVFNDLRRTNNLIGVPLKTSTATSIPQRLLYPQSEVNTNPNTPTPIPGIFVKTPVNQ